MMKYIYMLLFVCILCGFSFLNKSFAYQVDSKIKNKVDTVMHVVEKEWSKDDIHNQISKYQKIIDSFSKIRLQGEDKLTIDYLLYLFQIKVGELKAKNNFSYGGGGYNLNINNINNTGNVVAEADLLNIGTWIWNNNLLDDVEDIINKLKEHNINKVYIQYSSDRDINDYRRILSLLNYNNIKVYLLDGNPNWIYPDQWSGLNNLLSFYDIYQNQVKSNERFYRIKLDVEPWTLSEWQTNQEDIVIKYQLLINNILVALGDRNDLSLDIPFWFDEIEYNNSLGSGQLFNFLAKNVSELTLMSYRNKFNGSNGIKELVNYEVGHNLINKNYLLNIGIETAESQEGNHISFYGFSRNLFYDEFNLIKNYIKDTNIGIDVHYYDSFISLVE